MVLIVYFFCYGRISRTSYSQTTAVLPSTDQMSGRPTGYFMCHNHENFSLYISSSLTYIISSRNTVTSEWTAKLGSVDIQSSGKSEQIFDISLIHVHPNYNISSNENDIALIKLHEPAKLNNNVSTICLPDMNGDKLYEDGNICHVAGWGTDRVFTDSVYPLSSLALPIVSNSECDTFDNFAVTDQMLCAGHKDGIDTCQGDGGGALMCDSGKGFVAVGINSVGEGCGDSKHYGVYTDVRPHLDWIKVQLFA